MGYIPHVVMPAFKISPRSCGPSWTRGRGSHTNNYLIKDQVAPEHIWGLIHQGTKPRINPCPGTRPGSLDISRDLTAWSQTKNPNHLLGGLSRVFTAWSQTKNPSYLQGALSRVFTAWSQTKNPSYLMGALSRVFTAWSQTKNPSYLLGSLTRVFCHGSDCLVPDQEPHDCTGGPSSQLGS
jgi:hypothetical protein